jgi:hypothetical protein
MSKGWKQFINTTILLISIGLSTYIFIQMTNEVLVKWLFFALVALYEIIMQGVLGASLSLFKRCRWNKWCIFPAIFCFLLYITAYVTIYAVPTAMGVFLLHADKQAVTAEVTEIEYEIQKRILDLDLDSIENYNLQMRAESKTGYGRQSEKVTTEQNKLRENLENRLAMFLEVSKEKEKSSVDVFESLSDSLKTIKEMSPRTIKFVMFATVFFGMYLGLIITHQEMPDWRQKYREEGQEEQGKEVEGKENKTSVLKSFKESSAKTSTKKTSKSSRKLRNKTSQTSPESLAKTSQKTSDKSYQEEKSFPESSAQSSPESLTQKVSLGTTQENIKKFATEMERFVDASIRDTGILNSARRVSMMTGIPIDRCNEYRKQLDEMEIGGVSVVETTQGGSRANFEKEVILERVREAI